MFIVRKEAHGGSVAVFEQWLDCREERGATRSSCKCNEDEHDDNVFSTAMGSSLLKKMFSSNSLLYTAPHPKAEGASDLQQMWRRSSSDWLCDTAEWVHNSIFKQTLLFVRCQLWGEHQRWFNLIWADFKVKSTVCSQHNSYITWPNWWEHLYDTLHVYGAQCNVHT